MSTWNYLLSIFLFRHSGEAFPGLEPGAGHEVKLLRAIQVIQKVGSSGCRIKSGMTENFGLSNF